MRFAWIVPALLYRAIGVSSQAGQLCTSPNNVFHVRVDLFASDLGYYTFKECGKTVNPVLGLELGQTYTFVQEDRSNYYHPFGISGTPFTYRQGSQVLGRQVYERRFVEPPFVWAGYDDFTVEIRIDDISRQDYQYYCIIHQGMEGSIQVLQSGVSDKNGADSYKSTFVDIRTDFDKRCGTYGLSPFQLPNPLCPDRFVCGTEQVSDSLREFADCLGAANCAMMSGMTTGVQATADSALFIHQMIPHHENAVNTAKTLLSTGNLLCPDLTDQANPDCVLEGILYEIIAGQNSQIQQMRRFLSSREYPQEDNCDVYVETVSISELATSNGEEVNSGGLAEVGNLSLLFVLLAVSTAVALY